MSNIDLTIKLEMHDRFKTRSLLIRLLLTITPFQSFSAAC